MHINYHLVYQILSNHQNVVNYKTVLTISFVCFIGTTESSTTGPTETTPEVSTTGSPTTIGK